MRSIGKRGRKKATCMRPSKIDEFANPYLPNGRLAGQVDNKNRTFLSQRIRAPAKRQRPLPWGDGIEHGEEEVDNFRDC